MIFKIVSLFLVGMGVLAMFGKLTMPGAKRIAAAKCQSCCWRVTALLRAP